MPTWPNRAAIAGKLRFSGKSGSNMIKHNVQKWMGEVEVLTSRTVCRAEGVIGLVTVTRCAWPFYATQVAMQGNIWFV